MVSVTSRMDGRGGKMYSFCAMYSFRMSFCSVPETAFQSTPCCSATARYMAHSTAAGELMVIETVTSAQRDAAEQNLHVFERRDGRAALAHFAFRQRVVGIVAHQRRQIEGHREAGLALLQQIVIAAVGLLRRGESGELPHGPQPPAVHGLVDAARVRKLARRSQIAARIEIPQLFRPVKRLDGHPADGGVLLLRDSHVHILPERLSGVS